MASSIIGRTACPECDFEAAHVKIKDDPAPGKEPLPYRYCPSCGASYHPRSKAAAVALLKKTRLEKAARAEQPAAPEPSSTPAAAPPAAPASSDTAEVPVSPTKKSWWEGLEL